MSYEKRLDGREMTQTRPMDAKAGIIPKADGSAMFKIGKTVAYAAVYGPRNLFPKFKQDPTTGILRVNYNMMPFSSVGDRVRPGGNRRSKEISMVTENSLKSMLDLTEFPNAVVDVFIELPQTDAGTRCAGICAASIALADAGLSMKDMIAAVAVGVIDGQPLVDLMYDEEAFDGQVADIPIAVVPSTKKFTLLQMDGEVKQEHLREALKMGLKSIEQIYEVQKNALKNKFAGESQ